MNELLLTLIDPEAIMHQIHRKTLAEAWVKLYRIRCPHQWPTVTAIVSGLAEIGQKCGREHAGSALKSSRLYESQINLSSLRTKPLKNTVRSNVH
jgi:hypothetical protein